MTVAVAGWRLVLCLQLWTCEITVICVIVMVWLCVCLSVTEFMRSRMLSWRTATVVLMTSLPKRLSLMLLHSPFYDTIQYTNNAHEWYDIQWWQGWHDNTKVMPECWGTTYLNTAQTGVLYLLSYEQQLKFNIFEMLLIFWTLTLSFSHTSC